MRSQLTICCLFNKTTNTNEVLALQGERAVFDCLDFTVVYVDNNLVHSNDVDEHIEQCKKVVRCLTKAGLKINLDKTKLCYKHILFMGSMILCSLRVYTIISIMPIQTTQLASHTLFKIPSFQVQDTQTLVMHSQLAKHTLCSE